MEKTYWQEYWDNYYKFMAVYLRELQNAYPNKDVTEEYVEVAKLFYPSMNFEQYESYNDYYNNDDYNDDDYNDDDYNDNGYNYNNSQPTPYISPGGGKFTIDNCKKMTVVKIDMKKGYDQSSFYMIVDRYDKKSIQGYRIYCGYNGKIQFKAMSLDYDDISYMECVF